MYLEWSVQKQDELTLCDISEMFFPTDDRIIPSNFQNYPKVINKEVKK